MIRFYYYLNRENDWSRRLTFFEILFFILIRKINQFDTIWHTGLCPKKVRHPNNCVHPSIQVREISYIPSWIFKKGYGLPEALRRINKVLKNWYSKEKNFEKFAESPIEAPEKLLEDAIGKNIIQSVRAIHNLSSGGEFKVSLTFITIEDEIKKESYQTVIREVESNYYQFQIILPKIPNIGGVMYKESYGLNNELYLEGKSTRLRVLSNSVDNFSTKYPYEPQILKGQFTQINQVVSSNYENVFIRLVIVANDTALKSPLSILERSGTILFDKEEFNIHDSLMGVKFRTGSGYSEVLVNGKNYHIYSVNKSLIIIECLDKNDIGAFKLEAGQIRLALAFLSGYFYRGEVYYLSSHMNDFSEIEGVWYEKERPNIMTINQIINPGFYFQRYERESDEYKKENRKHHRMFPNDVFSSMCNKMLSTDEIQRAIKLIVDGGGSNDPIQKGALYSVAIETLTSFFSEKNKKSLKPIKDKELSGKVKERILQVIDEYSGDIGDEGTKILKNKISNLNSPTNRDKLIKPFEIYNIKLTKKDIQSIDKRNKYLHGKTPLNTKELFELNKLALELHYLAGCLLLKYVGYEGHVINLPIWYIYKNEEKFIALIRDKSQEQIKLLDKMKKSIEDNDMNMFNELRAKLQEFNDNHEINNMINII